MAGRGMDILRGAVGHLLEAKLYFANRYLWSLKGALGCGPRNHIIIIIIIIFSMHLFVFLLLFCACSYRSLAPSLERDHRIGFVRRSLVRLAQLMRDMQVR